MEVNNKRIINSWCMYDWANSVYSLVITSTIFPIYYESVTKSNDGAFVNFLGYEVVNTVLYSFSISLSFLITALILPVLSGIADYSGKKKFFMKIFVYLGSFACMGLYFFDGSNIELGILLSVLASIGYSGSLVFYDAFLPEIASQDRYDKVSAKGYSLGYIGSVILLVFNLYMISNYEQFGFTEENSDEAVRFSFLLVGLWWIGFSQITFYNVPDNVYGLKPQGNIWTEGYRELKKVLNSLLDLKVMKLFLLAFFFYNMGVQTVMYLAATFGAKELKLPGDKLIITILIIQVVAIFGAYLFAYVSKIKGNKISLLIMVFIWVFICLGAYFVSNEYEFYSLAFVVGLVMGGIQSLSRATYAKLIPENSIDHASYFSFYDVAFYLSAVIGTISYGLIEMLTGSMRNSTLALMLFFIVGMGFLLLIKIPMHEAIKEENHNA